MGQKAKDAMRVIIQLGILFLTLAAPARDALRSAYGGEGVRLKHKSSGLVRLLSMKLKNPFRLASRKARLHFHPMGGDYLS
jgi:hypothetical protein